VTQKKGGEGAVREVVEMLLNGLGKKEEAIHSILSPSKNSAKK
jgi:3-deoxy-D-manno-octulosonate 8-phosphate phosphatase KdsC-like HAD superfamily phosphatase